MKTDKKKIVRDAVHWVATSGVGLAALDVADQVISDAEQGVTINWWHAGAVIAFAVTRALRENLPTS